MPEPLTGTLLLSVLAVGLPTLACLRARRMNMVKYRQFLVHSLQSMLGAVYRNAEASNPSTRFCPREHAASLPSVGLPCDRFRPG